MAKEDTLQARLAKLGPESRARVETALAASIEQELVGETINPMAQFSRGWVFSRVTSLASGDDRIINEAMGLDDATFETFAKRLARIKSIKDSQG